MPATRVFSVVLTALGRGLLHGDEQGWLQELEACQGADQVCVLLLLFALVDLSDSCVLLDGFIYFVEGVFVLFSTPTRQTLTLCGSDKSFPRHLRRCVSGCISPFRVVDFFVENSEQSRKNTL